MSIGLHSLIFYILQLSQHQCLQRRVLWLDPSGIKACPFGHKSLHNLIRICWYLTFDLIVMQHFLFTERNIDLIWMSNFLAQCMKERCLYILWSEENCVILSFDYLMMQKLLSVLKLSSMAYLLVYVYFYNCCLQQGCVTTFPS